MAQGSQDTLQNLIKKKPNIYLLLLPNMMMIIID